MNPAPPPKSLLDRHRLLSPSASVKVSPLCLGAMNFGDAWAGMMGAMSKESVFELLDYFHSQGGNFIDTANNYQSEQSEIWIGEWLHKHPGIRDQMVIATKYTTSFSNHKGHDNIIHSNSAGNGSKSLHVSVRNSLHKLKTDYIDILYVHWWDFTTSIPELMQSLNTLVQQGKVIYLGVSDTPAWIVSKANQYARDHALRQFVVYQGNWSAALRDFERDIIPMCAAEGMGLAPWGALGGGNFKTKKQREEMKGEGRNMRPATENQIKLTDALEIIANRKNTAITSVALAYVMAKAPYVFPIVGGRKIEHLKGNIEALGLELSEEDVAEIEAAAPFDVGFPLNFLSQKPGGAKGPGDSWLMNTVGHFDYVEDSKPIKPSKG
ncbi:NADP-dependent oxidoreductase domain-containing protein [Usnea florida]